MFSVNKNQMDRFRAEAENAFLNFSGEELDNYVGDDESYAGDDEGYDGDDESYDGDDEYYGGSGLDKINPNDKTLSFSIENTATLAGDPSRLDAVLFGGYRNLYLPNFGNPTGIVITLGESSYSQFLAETLSSPVLLKGLRYFVKNEIQLSNTMEMVEETATGAKTSMKYQPATKVDPRSYKSNLLIDGGFTMPVSGRHTLVVPVNKGEQVTLVMSVATRVDQAKTLEGKAVLEVAKKKKKKVARRVR